MWWRLRWLRDAWVRSHVQFIFTEPQTEYERLIGGFHYINTFGKIEPGDDQAFKAFVENAAPPPRTTMYIDSTGGDVEAAIGIARHIRTCWFETSIGSYQLEFSRPAEPVRPRELKSGKCLSAATLVYLGGKLRHFPKESNFGVHQFSFKNASPRNVEHSQILSAKIAMLLADLGVSPAFMEVSSSTLGTEINRIGIEKLKELGVVTGGVTDVSWSVQARSSMIYVRGERDSIFGHHKVILAYAKDAGFLFWAVIEAQGREDELTTLGLVEIVVNGESLRIDISERCSRHVSGIYVNIIAKISENEAGLLANSESFGVQVRFSSEAEVFLGIDAMPTLGGQEELQSLFICFSRTTKP